VADLLVIVPTRGRPGNAQRLVDAWKATHGFHHADLLLVVDADDPHAGAYRVLAEDQAAWPVEVRWMPTWQPMVAKLNGAAVEHVGRHNALGFMGDDHLPRTHGWAAAIVKALTELGTGVVYGDDLHRGQQLATHWFMTADIVTTFGAMVPAPVSHQFCDRAVMDLAATAGCLRYLPDVTIEHMHYAAGKAAKDPTYAIANKASGFRADQAAYELWRAEQLPADAAKVRAAVAR
jgi:hypothetical protein